jgi:Holliday junction resolvase
VNSRTKGVRGEIEWRDWLRDRGCAEARRGQQFSGSAESPDVVGGWCGTHAEVKRVESLNIHKAMQQACDDCGGAVPYVAHRRNKGKWLITILADDVEKFARAVLGIKENA